MPRGMFGISLWRRDRSLWRRDNSLGRSDKSLGERDNSFGRRDDSIWRYDRFLRRRDDSLGRRDMSRLYIGNIRHRTPSPHLRQPSTLKGQSMSNRGRRNVVTTPPVSRPKFLHPERAQRRTGIPRHKTHIAKRHPHIPQPSTLKGQSMSNRGRRNVVTTPPVSRPTSLHPERAQRRTHIATHISNKKNLSTNP